MTKRRFPETMNEKESLMHKVTRKALDKKAPVPLWFRI